MEKLPLKYNNKIWEYFSYQQEMPTVLFEILAKIAVFCTDKIFFIYENSHSFL